MNESDPYLRPRSSPSLRGRGAAGNPRNRFEGAEWSAEYDQAGPRKAVATQYLTDRSVSIIARNNSPDIPFDRSINPYRGCEHGCAYCYARPTHEYLGYSAGLDFETKIVVKREAPKLLERELSSKSWEPRVLAMSGVTDPYQPIEKRLALTRGCLEVLERFRNPVQIVTKNKLVTRDIDILRSLAESKAAAVAFSVTSLKEKLTRVMEPRTSAPTARLRAISELASAGIPVGVMIAPVIPGLNDEEIPAILEAAKEAGAAFANFTILRLPYGVKEIFLDWLERHYPAKGEKIVSRIVEMRGGALNQSEFGLRMKGVGIWSEQMKAIFDLGCRRCRFESRPPELSTRAFRRPEGRQLELFER